jgi:hypothetical protein
MSQQSTVQYTLCLCTVSPNQFLATLTVSGFVLLFFVTSPQTNKQTLKSLGNEPGRLERRVQSSLYNSITLLWTRAQVFD